MIIMIITIVMVIVIIIIMIRIHRFSLEDLSKIWTKNHTSRNIRYKI